MTIPVFKPSMGLEEVKEVTAVLRSGWIGLGPKTAQFEQAFSRYIGTKYAIGLNSCTAALHLALNALGVKSGDVLVPAITFVSTAHAALYNNCKPVFVDVDEDTLCIDVKDLRRKISPQTKAIILVHYAGHPCEMDEIIELAEKKGIAVIEDAAHACGSEYKGRKIGTFGKMGCFSFHAVKNLATGDGGAITTNDKDADALLRKLRWLGINKDTFRRDQGAYSWYYEVEELGFKCHMNDVTAAIGLAQLRKLDKLNAKRRKIAAIYNKNFEELNWLTPLSKKDYVKSSQHLYVVKVENRAGLITHLAKKGISSSVHYTPLHLHPLYKRLGIGASVPVAEKVYDKILTLPMYPDLTQNQIKKIVAAVKSFKIKN